MNQWLSKLTFFIMGSAAGAVVTWRIVKRKFERIAQEEIDSVKEAFLNRREEEEQAEEAAKEYAEIVKTYNPINEVKPGPVKVERVEPYVITPDQYGEDDYEAISLTYYADNVLADFEDRVIQNIEEVVGSEAIGNIGAFADDVVHVRDEEQKIDYEIVRDPRKYIDVAAQGTPFAEDE